MYKNRQISTLLALSRYKSLTLLVSLILLVSGSLWACTPSKGTDTPSTLLPSTSTPTATPVPPTPPLPEPLTPTTTICAETTGIIEKGIIDTRLLDKPMRYNVYLPPCYAQEIEHHYPVLYMLHGQNFDEEQWLRIGAASAADKLIATKQVAPFIIVMPFDHSYKQPAQYKFDEVFLQLLIPQIDLAYRTLPEAAHRAIGGLSRGGAWAIHLGIRNPDVFGAIGAHSPAIFYADTSTMRLRLRDADKEHFPRIFMDAGEHDIEYENVIAFEKLLNEMNIAHEWHEYIGFHDEKYWSAHVEEYLRWYAQDW